VVDGAYKSGVEVPFSALGEFARGLEEKGLTLCVLKALFHSVDRATKAIEDGKESSTAASAEEAKLANVLLPLLHCIISSCPSARTGATAASAAHFLMCTTANSSNDGTAAAEAASSTSLNSPELIDAALLLVNDACAVNFTDADDEAKRTRVMQGLWSSLVSVARRAARLRAEAGWQDVLSRVYGAAHALLLGSTTVPFCADGDPRLDFVGDCGLPYVSMEPCNALVQTVLNYDEARAYLQHKYPAAYLSSLEYMTDPTHNISGVVPLSLQRYLEEAKRP
jgi:hypothetical protein